MPLATAAMSVAVLKEAISLPGENLRVRDEGPLCISSILCVTYGET